MTNSTVTKANYRSLGPDIWDVIFEHLSTIDMYYLEKTCSYFAQLLEKDVLWKPAFEELHRLKEQSIDDTVPKQAYREYVHGFYNQRLYIWGASLTADPVLIQELRELPIQKVSWLEFHGKAFLIILTFGRGLYALNMDIGNDKSKGRICLNKVVIKNTGETTIPEFADLVTSKTNMVLLSSDGDVRVYHCPTSSLTLSDGIVTFEAIMYPYSTKIYQLVCTDTYFAVRTESVIYCEIISLEAKQSLGISTLYYSGEGIIDISGKSNRFCRLSDEGMIMTTNILPSSDTEQLGTGQLQQQQQQSPLFNDYTSASPRRMGIVERLVFVQDLVFVLNSDGEVWLTDESILQLPTTDIWFQHEEDAKTYFCLETLQDIVALSADKGRVLLLDSKGRVYYWDLQSFNQHLSNNELKTEGQSTSSYPKKKDSDPVPVESLPVPAKAIVTKGNMYAAVVETGRENSVNVAQQSGEKMKQQETQATATFTIGALGRYFSRPLKRRASDELESKSGKAVKADD